MFIEVSINNQLQAYAVDSILRIDREEDGKATKSNPESRILTNSMYNALISTLRQRDPLEDIAYFITNLKPGIDKLLSKLNK